MKTIALDIRPLLEQQWGGVSWYTYYLVNGLVSEGEQGKLRLVLFYNQRKVLHSHIIILLKKWKNVPNVYVAGYRIPNKLLNLSMRFLKYPYIDDLLTIKQYNNIIIDRIDYFIAPNLNFLALTGKTKLITICHDLSWETFPECFTLRQRLWHALINPKTFFTHAHRIITVSQSTLHDLVDLYGIAQERITVIPPGIDHELFHPIKDEKRLTDVRARHGLPARFILFVGTLEPRKNIETLIEAFDRVRARDVHLLIIGKEGWKFDRIYRFFLRAEKREQIHFLSFVSADDLPALYSLASCFVYPSFYEGFGFPPLEAMACGVPTIVGHGSSLPEIVGDACLMVDPFNIASLTQAMEQLLSDEMLCATLKKRGLQQAQQFNLEKSIAQILTLLSSL